MASRSHWTGNEWKLDVDPSMKLKVLLYNRKNFEASFSKASNWSSLVSPNQNLNFRPIFISSSRAHWAELLLEVNHFSLPTKLQVCQLHLHLNIMERFSRLLRPAIPLLLLLVLVTMDFILPASCGNSEAEWIVRRLVLAHPKRPKKSI